jgi:hypothetical protein
MKLPHKLTALNIYRNHTFIEIRMKTNGAHLQISVAKQRLLCALYDFLIYHCSTFLLGMSFGWEKNS